MNTCTLRWMTHLTALLAWTTASAPLALPAAEKARPPAEAGRQVQRAGRLLTEEQRARLREQFGAQRERLADLAAKLQQARREFHVAALAGADEEQLRQKARAVAELEVERLLVQAKALSKVRAELPDKARARLDRLSQRPDNDAKPKAGKQDRKQEKQDKETKKQEKEAKRPDKEVKKQDKEVKQALKPKKAKADD